MDGDKAVIQVLDHREFNETRYWLYIDMEASASNRTSAWIVCTCASRYGGEGLFLSDTCTGLSTWKHAPAGPDRKMLWDLIPVDNDMRFFMSSISSAMQIPGTRARCSSLMIQVA